MRRGTRARRYGGALVAAGLLLVVTGCGTPSDDGANVVEAPDSRESASALLAQASASTSAVETGRMRVTYRITGQVDDEEIDAGMTAEGAFADGGRSVELTLDMSELMGELAAGDPTAPESLVMREILVGTDLYMQVEADPPTAFSPGLDPDAWFRVDVSDLMADAGSGAFGGVGGVPNGPTGYLESLKAAGATVVEAGTDVVDGTEVTVYRGRIDPEDAVAAADPDTADEVRRAFRESGMGSIPFTAYVDDGGMVRRMEMELSMDMGGASVTMHMTMDLYDLGAPVVITPPPPDEVVDEATVERKFEAVGDVLQDS